VFVKFLDFSLVSLGALAELFLKRKLSFPVSRKSHRWIRRSSSAYDRRQLLDKAAFLDFTIDIVFIDNVRSHKSSAAPSA
jgi:hypothetical protein